MPGVVDTWVGYTGGASEDPTYDSVCSGDGHTEALRLQLDPSLSYEEFLEAFVDNPRVASFPRPGEKVQYKTAIWPQNEEQMRIAQSVVEASGKAVPVEAPAAAWHDAEEWHQHFYRDFKDFPEDDEDDDA